MRAEGGAAAERPKPRGNSGAMPGHERILGQTPRFSTLGSARHAGAFPVQAPDKAPETSTWSPWEPCCSSTAPARLNDVAASTLVIADDGLVKEQQASHDGDLRQRPAEPACQSRPDPDDPGSKAADVSREQSRKLSGNERHEPDSMPARIEQLEKSVGDRHAAVLGGGSFHRQGRAGIGGGKIRLGGLERDLAAACSRWHVLEERAG